MSRILYTERFLHDMQQVALPSKQSEIYDSIDLLQTIPSLGSARLPQAIEESFGGTVRKLAVTPFLVIYEYLDSEGTILILGLVHERTAY